MVISLEEKRWWKPDLLLLELQLQHSSAGL